MASMMRSFSIGKGKSWKRQPLTSFYHQGQNYYPSKRTSAFKWNYEAKSPFPGVYQNYGFLEDSLTQQSLKRVEGAFITSAILEIFPVKRIEGQEFSPEKPRVIRKEWRRIRRFCLQKS
jgi:hypothetical protein